MPDGAHIAGPVLFLTASRVFQTRHIREWMDDDGPASRAHLEPAHQHAPDDDAGREEQSRR